MRTILATVLMAFLIAGCGGDGASASDGELRLEIQRLIDDGEIDRVITLLETDSTYQGAYPDDEYKLYLASAYLARAGFNLDTVLDLLIEDDNATQSVDQSSVLDDTIKDLAGTINLFDSVKASTLFKEAIDINCSTDDYDSLTYNEQEVCLFIGISGLLKTASILNYVVDLDTFLDDDNTTTAASTLATSCALEYAINSSRDDFNLTVPYTCENDANLTIDGNVTFAPDNMYEQVMVDVNGTSTFYKLVNFATPVRSTILAEGNCTVTYVECGDVDYDAGCYSCPLAQGDEVLPSIAELLLEVVNEDITALTPILAEDDNATNDVDEFRLDFTGGEDRDVTEDDLVDYFNDANS